MSIFSPYGRAERKKIPQRGILAKEPVCREPPPIREMGFFERQNLF
jgi:hypothetical protein